MYGNTQKLSKHSNFLHFNRLKNKWVGISHSDRRFFIFSDYFEVQFDDGYKKVLHRSKLREDVGVKVSYIFTYIINDPKLVLDVPCKVIRN